MKVAVSFYGIFYMECAIKHIISSIMHFILVRSVFHLELLFFVVDFSSEDMKYVFIFYFKYHPSQISLT